MRAGTLGAVTAAAHRRNPSPPSYTGPLDLTATQAVVAYGQRALSAAKLGTAVYTIREDGGDTTQSFNSDATTGAIDVAAITAFLNGANGFGANWNDQSGHASNALQADPVSQPQWTANVANSQPGLAFDGSDDLMATAAEITPLPGVFTCFFVMTLTQDGQIFGTNGGFVTPFTQAGIGGSAGAHSLAIWAKTDNTNQANRSVHGPLDIAATPFLIDFAVSIPLGDFYLNGVSQPVSDTAVLGTLGNLAGRLAIGDDDVSPDSPFGGDLIEVLIFPAVVADADRLAIRQNIAAYYGIVLGP